MSITEKIKTINNKIEQNKAKYDLDRQTAKIPALSSGNVSKLNFWVAKMFYGKRLTRKSCYNKKTQIFSVRQRNEKAN